MVLLSQVKEQPVGGVGAEHGVVRIARFRSWLLPWVRIQLIPVKSGSSVLGWFLVAFPHPYQLDFLTPIPRKLHQGVVIMSNPLHGCCLLFIPLSYRTFIQKLFAGKKQSLGGPVTGRVDLIRLGLHEGYLIPKGQRPSIDASMTKKTILLALESE